MGTLIGTCSSRKRGEKVLRYWTTARRSASGRSGRPTIPVQRSPCVTVRNRSSSVGSKPDNVERNLKMPSRKSRGRTRNMWAAAPLPSPFIPWHIAQLAAYTWRARDTRAADSWMASAALTDPVGAFQGPHQTTENASAAKTMPTAGGWMRILGIGRLAASRVRVARPDPATPAHIRPRASRSGMLDSCLSSSERWSTLKAGCARTAPAAREAVFRAFRALTVHWTCGANASGGAAPPHCC